MRYLFLILFFMMSAGAMAQFTFNVKGGVNDMHVHSVSSKVPGYKFSDGLGWQVGANTEYQTSSQIGFFLYIGFAFRHSAYDKDSTFANDTAYLYSYKPNLLAIPFGVGYKFPLTNPDLKLKVYVGINPQIGVGGKLKTYQLYYNNPFVDPNASTDLQKTLSDVRKINFGDNASSKKFNFDYAAANWGFQFGAGLELTRNAEIELLYSHGFTNALPGKRKTLDRATFSFVDLNFKIAIPNEAIKKYKEQHKK